MTTIRHAIWHVMRAAWTYLTPRPLRDAGPREATPAPPDQRAALAPPPAIAPDPAPELPPQPTCQYPTEVGYQWMRSHRFVGADAVGLVCQDCGEVWPKPRQQPE